MAQGMPWWKYAANRFLTRLENAIFGLHLAEYHTGYRAFRREALDQVNLDMNSDNFIFDQEIIAQFVNLNMRIAEVPVPTRYFPEASSASFVQSSVYGLSILWLLFRYEMHRLGLVRQRSFESLTRRYTAGPRTETPDGGGEEMKLTASPALLAAILCALSTGCGDPDVFNEGVAKGAAEAEPFQLDSEQVSISSAQLACGVNEELWDAPSRRARPFHLASRAKRPGPQLQRRC